MGKLKQFFRLLGISAKMDLAWLLRDTKYAILIMATELIANISTISGVFLIAVRFNGIGGMSYDEVLFMLAYSTMTVGLFSMFCGGGNNGHISRIIGRGQLEHMFIQPLSLPMQLLTMGFIPFTGGTNFVTGVVLVVIAVRRLALTVTLGWVVMLIAYSLTTLVLIVARSYLVSSAAFYSPVSAEEIASTAINGTWTLSTFPLSGMPKFLQIPLIALPILPDGLMAWFPALCLLGRPPLGLTQYYPMLFAVMLSMLAGAVFRKGLRYYVQRGSNRYVPHGFRN